jgi:hypothetical protein
VCVCVCVCVYTCSIRVLENQQGNVRLVNLITPPAVAQQLCKNRLTW